MACSRVGRGRSPLHIVSFASACRCPPTFFLSTNFILSLPSRVNAVISTIGGSPGYPLLHCEVRNLGFRKFLESDGGAGERQGPERARKPQPLLSYSFDFLLQFALGRYQALTIFWLASASAIAATSAEFGGVGRADGRPERERENELRNGWDGSEGEQRRVHGAR